MGIPELLGASPAELGAAAIGTVAIVAAVILAARILGLRSFAKMSAFDFAGTVATGTIVASVALGSAPLAVGVVALATLFAVQGVIGVLRRRAGLDRVIDNQPVLLMDGPRYLEANMRRCKVTRDDVHATLRSAGVLRIDEVRAVVLETTGDVSVLRGEPGGPPVDDALLEGVRRRARGRGGDGGSA